MRCSSWLLTSQKAGAKGAEEQRWKLCDSYSHSNEMPADIVFDLSQRACSFVWVTNDRVHVRALAHVHVSLLYLS
jgi:hypothetical protein